MKTEVIIAYVAGLIFIVPVVAWLEWQHLRLHNRKWRVSEKHGRYFIERCDAFIWFPAGGAYDAGFDNLHSAQKECSEMRGKYEENLKKQSLTKRIYPQ